jgi:glycosyltransferase involved in cell wall biosynthesis
MQHLAANLCPRGSVFWPGMLTGDAKWGALYNAQAFVLTSHQENFGIAVVEALACGQPVLISNQVNISKEIEEDQAGLVSNDTLEGVEHLFERWSQLSEQKKSDMKTCAGICYQKRFNIAVAVQNLLATIRSCAPPSREADIAHEFGIKSCL